MSDSENNLFKKFLNHELTSSEQSELKNSSDYKKYREVIGLFEDIGF